MNIADTKKTSSNHWPFLFLFPSKAIGNVHEIATEPLNEEGNEVR